MAKSRLLDILKVFSRLHLSPDARRVTTHRARTPPDRGTPRHASFPPLARRSANALALVTRLRARSRLRARLGLPKSRIGQVEKKREAHTSPRLRRSDDRLVFPGGRPACRVRGVACPRQRARERAAAAAAPAAGSCHVYGCRHRKQAAGKADHWCTFMHACMHVP